MRRCWGRWRSRWSRTSIQGWRQISRSTGRRSCLRGALRPEFRSTQLTVTFHSSGDSRQKQQPRVDGPSMTMIMDFFGLVLSSGLPTPCTIHKFDGTRLRMTWWITFIYCKMELWNVHDYKNIQSQRDFWCWAIVCIYCQTCLLPFQLGRSMLLCMM